MASGSEGRLIPHSDAEKRIFIAAFLLAGLMVLADQISKIYIEHAFELHESRPVISGWLAVTSVRNRGAAWSILSGHGWLLLLIGAAVIAAAIRFFRYLTEGWRERYFAVFLVLSGVIGNSIDRLWRGEVVDFIHVHYRDVWHYPVFNLADIAICTGVGLFILSCLLRKSQPEADSASANRE